MKFSSVFKAVIYLSFFVFYATIVSFSFAQEATPTATLTPGEATSTPTPTLEATLTPTVTLSPTPTSAPSSSSSQTTSSSQTPTPSIAPVANIGGEKKKEVLGSATKLGSTSSGKEIAKWALAAIVGIGAIIAGLKVTRIHVEE